MTPNETRAAVLLRTADEPLPIGELTLGERAVLDRLPRGPRLAAWLTGRRALRDALTCCRLPGDTCGHRPPSPRVSLSHSAGMSVAAVALGPAGRIAGVGVDVERDREPDPRTAGFYLTRAERSRLRREPADRASDMLRLWTVKEALFKSDPDNHDAVLRDYRLDAPHARCGTAVRDAYGGNRFAYTSLAVPRGYVTVAVAFSLTRKETPMPRVDFDHMAKHISTLISVPADRLTPETTLAELVPDSFTFVEVAVDLQEEYEVILSQEDLRELKTLGDLASLLRERQQNGADA